MFRVVSWSTWFQCGPQTDSHCLTQSLEVRVLFPTHITTNLAVLHTHTHTHTHTLSKSVKHWSLPSAPYWMSHMVQNFVPQHLSGTKCHNWVILWMFEHGSMNWMSQHSSFSVCECDSNTDCYRLGHTCTNVTVWLIHWMLQYASYAECHTEWAVQWMSHMGHTLNVTYGSYTGCHSMGRTLDVTVWVIHRKFQYGSYTGKA